MRKNEKEKFILRPDLMSPIRKTSLLYVRAIFIRAICSLLGRGLHESARCRFGINCCVSPFHSPQSKARLETLFNKQSFCCWRESSAHLAQSIRHFLLINQDERRKYIDQSADTGLCSYFFFCGAIKLAAII